MLKMNVTTILEERMLEEIKRLYYIHLEVEADYIRKNYTWLKIYRVGKVLTAEGCLSVNDINYCVKIYYSPFYKYRMDRIYITNQKIEYNDDIHLYKDLSLCLYHLETDMPFNGIIPLHKMIPWITEWCHFYEEWKKYGVWLAPEIKHRII